jgi:glutathione synthase/RimK-type ligase-like ATP-grasp enzyme
LIVLTNSNLQGYLYILDNFLDAVKIVNPPASKYLSKPDINAVADILRIRVPSVILNTKPIRLEGNAGRHIIKPIRGEGGNGISFSERLTTDHFAQELITLPESLDCVFDIRIYVFMDEFLGSTIRIAGPEGASGGNIWGRTNTHQDGNMIYFENHIRPRCPAELRPMFDKVRDWLGMREPNTEMKAAAINLAHKLNLTYCGIDFIFDQNKKWYVIDVNPNAMHGYRTTADRIRMKRAWEIAKAKAGEN